ncbi:hypothetical protein Hanom_Chr03g00239811 [Helianthus anomalus]
MELGSSHYDEMGNKSEVACWRFEPEKQMCLLRAPYYDPDLSKRGRGLSFHSRLEKEVRTNFATMNTAEPIVRRNPGVRDSFTRRIRKFKFWAYDPVLAEAVVVTEEQSIRILNSYDLVSFHEEDILVLTHHQIRTNEKYEECAKSWTSDAANILKNYLFSDPPPDPLDPRV